MSRQFGRHAFTRKLCNLKVGEVFGSWVMVVNWLCVWMHHQHWAQQNLQRCGIDMQTIAHTTQITRETFVKSLVQRACFCCASGNSLTDFKYILLVLMHVMVCVLHRNVISVKYSTRGHKHNDIIVFTLVIKAVWRFGSFAVFASVGNIIQFEFVATRFLSLDLPTSSNVTCGFFPGAVMVDCNVMR